MSRIKVRVKSVEVKVKVKVKSMSFLFRLGLMAGNSRIIAVATPLAAGNVGRRVIHVLNIAHIRLVIRAFSLLG